MIWTCSVPETAGWLRGVALAAVTPVAVMAAAAAAAPAAASSLRWWVSMRDSFLLVRGFRGFSGGEVQLEGSF